MILELKKDQLKTAIADVLPTIKRPKDMPALRRVRVIEHDGGVWMEASDRFIAFRTMIANTDAVHPDDDIYELEPFELSIESLELLSKLSPQKIDISNDGITVQSKSGNVSVGKIQEEAFPAIHKLINEVWGMGPGEWGIDSEPDEDSIPGINPEHVKHIKGVYIIPRPDGAIRAAKVMTTDNRLEGIIMPTRIARSSGQVYRG